MFNFHQKRKFLSIVNSVYFQAFLLALILWMGFNAYERFKVAMDMRERSELAKTQMIELEKSKNNLEEQVEYLSSERGIEAEMRRQFDVALPGEQVVVIINDDNEGPEILPMSTSTNNIQDKKWYQFWR